MAFLFDSLISPITNVSQDYSKKSSIVTTTTNANQYTSSYNYSPNISVVSNSPNGQISSSPAVNTATSPLQYIPISIPTSQTSGSTASSSGQGIMKTITDNLTGIAVVGVIGVIAYSYFKKKK